MNRHQTIDYDQIASGYARHRQVHPEVLKGLVNGSGIGPAARVLEIGCGTGNYLAAIASLVGCSCWGIDPSAEMLSRARERSPEARFQLGKAEKLDLAGELFDLAFSVDVIHHVGDHAAYFREAYRVLKPGGRLCTVTDSEWIIRRREPLSTYFPETVEKELCRYPRISLLRGLMAQTGFIEIVEEIVEFFGSLTDIEAYRHKAFSSLHLIPEEAFQRGIARMEQDLRVGPIPYVSRYTLLWGRKPIV